MQSTKVWSSGDLLTPSTVHRALRDQRFTLSRSSINLTYRLQLPNISTCHRANYTHTVSADRWLLSNFFHCIAYTDLTYSSCAINDNTNALNESNAHADSLFASSDNDEFSNDFRHFVLARIINAPRIRSSQLRIAAFLRRLPRMGARLACRTCAEGFRIESESIL